jgi:hypothetical protein
MLADQDQERVARFDGLLDGKPEVLARLDLVDVHEHPRGAEPAAERLVKPPGVA